MISGVVLAGGRSRRFGSNKALATFEGARLVDRVLAALGAVCDERLVVGGEIEGLPADVRRVEDRFPGEGPLGGLVTALGAARGEHVLLVACDLPLVTPRLFAALLARRAEADVVVPLSPRGGEPMCAVYARAARSAFEEAFGRGERRLHPFAPELRVVEIPVAELPDAEGLANVNTVEDLQGLDRSR